MTGDQLRAALAGLKLTQANFAEIAGLHMQTVSKYCRGAMEVPRWVDAIVNLLRERQRPTRRANMRKSK